MPTQEKMQSVESLRERLGTAKTAVLTEYRGLTVRQLSDLRKQLKAASAEYKVVKNRLAQKALSAAEGGDTYTLFKGPVAIAYAPDPVTAAKINHLIRDLQKRLGLTSVVVTHDEYFRCQFHADSVSFAKVVIDPDFHQCLARDDQFTLPKLPRCVNH